MKRSSSAFLASLPIFCLVWATPISSIGHDSVVSERSPTATTLDSDHGVRRRIQAANGALIGLSLYDTATKTIMALTDNMKIAFHELRHTIIADLNGTSGIESVHFRHSQAKYVNVDNTLQYAMCGKNGTANLNTCSFLKYGRHTVTATAFPRDNGMGRQVGLPVTLTFTIFPPCGSNSDALVAYMNGAGILSKTSLSLSGTTPLDRALQHLVASNNKTGVQLSTCIQADNNRLYQRFAYLALIFSTGKGSATDWYDEANECQWTGISCNGNTVTGLALSRQGLQGSIPDDVGLWTGLTTFDVSLNQLGGSLPSSIGSWTSLTTFDVRLNQLVGSLPSSIGSWTGLTYVDVHRNQFSGTIPNEISKWKPVTDAFFDANMFQGTMPSSFCQRDWSNGLLSADCREVACSCCNFCF
jgi:hypothetical protein